jgi:hypothetical protein
MLFENKLIVNYEIQSGYYSSNVYFIVNMIFESGVQTLIGLLYTLITWCPNFKNNDLIYVYIIYTLVITLQINVANTLVQFFSVLVNNREIALSCLCGYLSISFLLLIGQNLQYKTQIMSYIQYLSYLRYPVNTLFLLLNKEHDIWITLVIEKLNLNATQVYELGIYGNIAISIGILVGLNILILLKFYFF